MFPASRIAAALGRPVRSVRRALSAIPTDGTLVVNGNTTVGWFVSSLPIKLQAELKEEARRRGYLSEEHILRAPPSRWEPDVPMSKLDEAAVRDAALLQRALTPTLQRLHSDTSAELSEIVAEGLAAYRKVIGHEITKRHFDRLLKRTIDRDHGAEEWSRVELFLPERIAVKKAPIISIGNHVAWQPMLSIVAQVAEKREATAEDLCLFWDHAFACYETLLAKGRSEKRARRDLRKVIEEKVPFISARGRALEIKIKRTLARWISGGRTAAAIKDKRGDNQGRPRASTLPVDYRDKLITRAVLTAGGLSQAFRESHEQGWCPADVARAYPINPDDKSYVPETIRRELQPEIERLAPLAIGPRYAELHGPYVDRDYTNMPSGVQFQSDDCTLPVYFYVTNADGSFTVTRGQFLPWIDTRTTFIVTFQLIPEKSYDSIEIMRGIARLHDEFGLPEELYFEHGIWGSKLIDGSDRENVPWKDFAFGLSGIGVRVRHANSPNAKIIERVLGALQDRMNNLRGYCGRDEKKDCPEETKRALQLVNGGSAHPSEFFYSIDEWVRELEKICNAYNAAVQNGKLLDGLTPEEAFVNFRKSPPIQLPPQLRYLLARHRREVTVKPNGIEIQIGRRKFIYKDERTGSKVHERVIAWFNPEQPESICVTDLNRKNPFTVRRASAVDAYQADPEAIERAQRENAAQTKYVRTRWGQLRKNFPEEFQRARRDAVIAPRDAVALGIAMNEQQQQSNVAAQEHDRLRTKGNRIARKLGLDTAGRRITPDRVEALEKLDRAGVKATNPYAYEEET